MQRELTMQRELDFSMDHVKEFCRRWRIEELMLDRPHSPAKDADMRVKFAPEAEWSLSDRMQMRREFRSLSGRDIRFDSWKPALHRRPRMQVVYNG